MGALIARGLVSNGQSLSSVAMYLSPNNFCRPGIDGPNEVSGPQTLNQLIAHAVVTLPARPSGHATIVSGNTWSA